MSLHLQQLTESLLGRLPRLKNRAATLFHGRKRAVTPVSVRFLVVFLPPPPSSPPQLPSQVCTTINHPVDDFPNSYEIPSASCYYRTAFSLPHHNFHRVIQNIDTEKSTNKFKLRFGQNHPDTRFSIVFITRTCCKCGEMPVRLWNFSRKFMVYVECMPHRTSLVY